MIECRNQERKFRDVTAFRFHRNELLFITVLVVVTGASLPTIHASLEGYGVWGALMAAFNISAIVWAAYWLGLQSIASSGAIGPASRLDLFICSSAIAISFLPVGGALWIVLAGVGAYLVLSAGSNQHIRNAGWVFIAITVPTFWGRRIFNFFSDSILEIDAGLVSVLTRTERLGNVVKLPGSEGSLIIGAPCSSMANVSLAVLCWMLFWRYAIRKRSIYNLMWCGIAVISIMAINVVRITTIAYYPQYYGFLHDGGGVVIFSYLSALAAVGFSYLGVLHVNAHER